LNCSLAGTRQGRPRRKRPAQTLIIANDEYEQEALHNLLAPGADAEALDQVLGDAQIGGFSVQVVRNEPSHVIEAQIEDLFSESRPDDLLLLHFSGHGLKSESGGAVLRRLQYQAEPARVHDGLPHAYRRLQVWEPSRARAPSGRMDGVYFAGFF
jgi:hypothetical protein